MNNAPPKSLTTPSSATRGRGRGLRPERSTQPASRVLRLGSCVSNGHVRTLGVWGGRNPGSVPEHRDPADERSTVDPLASLTIANLFLSNWKCFEGETTLALEPKAYGVFAVDRLDRDRSNWLGKTSLTEAIDYVLTGRTPKTTAARPLKSGWITDGAEKGEVTITFSNGAIVRRTAGRKSPERLYYFPPGDPERVAVQDAAQQKIDEMLGLTKADAATWCFRQGAMSALLSMDPAERLALFAGWFKLESLEECQAMAAAARATIEKEKQEATRTLDIWRATRQQWIERAFLATGQSFEDAIAGARVEEGLAAADVALLDAEERQTAERRGLAADAARYDQIVVKGRALVEQLGAAPRAEDLAAEARRIDAEIAEYVVMVAQAKESRRSIMTIASGDFDGRCPLAGAPCPSAGFVTETVRTNRTALETTGIELDRLSIALAGARDRAGVVASKIRSRERIEGQIRELRASAGSLADRKRRWVALGGLAGAQEGVSPTGARDRATRARGRLQELTGAEVAVEDADRKIALASIEIDRLTGVAEIPTAAASVFEQARREIAEGVLAEIAGNANEILATIGVDLEVAITWAREGSGLADACPGCGAGYPASRKVRHCGKCGAPRGAKVVEKLDIEPSERSGAADDFGGIAVTLGASRWLRGDRESEWATATIDEATSQMDASLRRAFAARLPEVLRIAGFRQALVISHHRETIEALPGRIEISGRGGRSTARVVA